MLLKTPLNFLHISTDFSSIPILNLNILNVKMVHKSCNSYKTKGAIFLHFPFLANSNHGEKWIEQMM